MTCWMNAAPRHGLLAGLSLGILGVAIAPTLYAPAPSHAQVINDKRLQNSRLSPSQLQQLEASGLKIVVPTYVPAGFQPVSIDTRSDQRFGPSYVIVYRKGNLCFGVEGISGGIGDIPKGSSSYRVKNAVLGTSTLEQYREAQGAALIGSWAGRGPFYRFVGANYKFLGGDARDLSGCQDLALKEALLVAEGLRFVRDDRTLNNPSAGSGGLQVNDSNSPTSKVIRYPAVADLNEFKRNIKTYKSGVQLSSAERSQRLAYQQTWAKVNPAGAKFTGTWVSGDRTYFVYPSKVKSRLCVITLKDGKYEFSNAQGIALEMRYLDNQFFWVDQPDMLAARDSGTGKLYPIFAATGTPDPARKADFSFGFSNAECTTELPGS
jgi:hypothetical protein